MDTPLAGLCAQCRHCRTVATVRGVVFYRCMRAETDAAFTRYPRLPVLMCSGFEATVERSRDD